MLPLFGRGAAAEPDAATGTKWIVFLRHCPFPPAAKRLVVTADSPLDAWRQVRARLPRFDVEKGFRGGMVQEAMRTWLDNTSPDQVPDGAEIVPHAEHREALKSAAEREAREQAAQRDATRRHQDTLTELLRRLVDATGGAQ